MQNPLKLLGTGFPAFYFFVILCLIVYDLTFRYSRDLLALTINLNFILNWSI